jgi:hypothetical protein
MNKKAQLAKLKRRIEQIKKELLSVGEMRPGSLSMQYNVCGKPGCRCKDKKNPQKHGPYYQLSYVRKGKSTTQFIRKEHLANVEMQLANYKAFKSLTDEWLELALEHAKLCMEKDSEGE